MVSEVRRVAWLLSVIALSSCGSEPQSPQGPVSPSSVTLGPSSTSGPVITTVPAEESSRTTLRENGTMTSITATTLNAVPEQLWPLALDVLAVMVVAPEFPNGYDRDLFPHWTVIDGCSTRDRVLIEESTSLPQVDPFGCRVVAGDWVSFLDGRTWDDPAEIQIDHLVALKEAWESGAWSWTEAERRAFANDMGDPRPLNAVTGSVNQSKSDLDPPNWLPPLREARCRYVADWIAVKARWQLTMDAAEISFLRTYLPAECPDQRVEPWDTVAVSPPRVSDSTAAPSPLNPIEIYFANCTEARAAGAAPINVGEPGYRTGLDRDKDGVACE